MVHIPSEIITKVNGLIYEFIWKGKADKVNRKLFAQNFEKGGYKMPNFKTLIKAAKVKWISRYLDGTKKTWKLSLQSFLKKRDLNMLLQSNFDMKEITDTYIPDYYLDSLNAWYECKEKMEYYQTNKSKQLLWFNKNYKINGKTVYFKNLLTIGIWTVEDLYTNGTVVPFNVWQKRGALVKDYMGWRNIISCIPVDIKTQLDNLKQQSVFYPMFGTKNNILVQNASEKDIKEFLHITDFKQMKENDFKIRQKLTYIHGNMDHETWQNIYTLPHDILKCNKLKELQYKILFRYLGTNKLLYKINIVTSPRCSLCEMNVESIEHLMFECMVSTNFWLSIQQCWNETHHVKFQLNLKDIMFGYNIHLGVSSIINKTINIIIMYGKSCIVKCKLNNSLPNIVVFKSTIKDALQVCNYESKVANLIQLAYQL